MVNKKPFLIGGVLLILVIAAGLLLMVLRPKPTAVKTQKPPVVKVSPTGTQGTKPTTVKAKKYKLVSSTTINYEIKENRNTFEEYLTKMGVFKANGLYDPISKQQVTATTVLFILTDKPQTTDVSILKGEKLGNSGAAFDVTNKTMIFSIYLYPSQYQKDEVSLSSSFTMVLRDIASVTTASNGKFVKDAPIEIRELLYKVVNNQITDNLFSITKKTIIK